MTKYIEQDESINPNIKRIHRVPLAEAVATVEASDDDTAYALDNNTVHQDDTDVSGNSWVLDEDDMTSDDATKVPTQQSVKVYADQVLSDAESYTDDAINGIDLSSKQDVISGASLSNVSPTVNDLVLIQDDSDANNLKTATAADIVALGGGGGDAFATSVSLCQAVFAGSALSFNQPPELTLDMSTLTAVTGVPTLEMDTSTTINLSNLGYVSGDIQFHCAACTSIDLSSLINLGGYLYFNAASFVSLALPAVTTITGMFTCFNSPLLTSFTINSGLLVVGGNFSITGAALDQTSVDNLLIRLAALDGTNGTTSYNGNTIDLSGGTSAAPSALGGGVAAASTLTGRGNTVTTN